MDYREMYLDEKEVREEAEAGLEEMERMVHVLWDAFAANQPEVADRLKAEEPYLREEFA